MMKFKFERLGFLYEAEIELANLTIICGENNTGKTYVTNSLYALLFAWQQLLAWDLSEDDTNHVPQLVSGDCFADYLIAVLNRFEQIKLIKPTNWKRRYFIFHCGNNRRNTLPLYAQDPPDNTQADKAHILQVANGEPIPLRKLLHKPL